MPPLRALPLLILMGLLLVAAPACERSAPPPKTAVGIGQPAPDFLLRDLEGNSWSLTDLRGNLVFLNFWATWCPPCREEMPSMEALRQELAGRSFRMVTVLGNDEPANAQRFLARIGAAMPVLLDPDGSTTLAYGITGVPETFIIDSQGILRERFIGGRDWNSSSAKAMLARYLP
ncbi:MAG: TlpA disulfide reductase family protein [Thermodesulfobacteriota bacterium]